MAAKKGRDYDTFVQFERPLWNAGIKRIAGVDEAGRGPLAGPLVAAACILEPDVPFPGVDDSKKLSPKKRFQLYHTLIHSPHVTYAIATIDANVIDQKGLAAAWSGVMQKAADAVSPDYLLIDGPRFIPIASQDLTFGREIVSSSKAKEIEGNSLASYRDQTKIPSSRLAASKTPYQCIIRGDSLSLSIAAASILAKVFRDDLMQKYHAKWPEYGFDAHKGYGTKRHLLALQKHGPCPIHRRSFAPVAKLKVANSR